MNIQHCCEPCALFDNMFFALFWTPFFLPVYHIHVNVTCWLEHELNWIVTGGGGCYYNSFFSKSTIVMISPLFIYIVTSINNNSHIIGGGFWLLLFFFFIILHILSLLLKEFEIYIRFKELVKFQVRCITLIWFEIVLCMLEIWKNRYLTQHPPTPPILSSIPICFQDLERASLTIGYCRNTCTCRKILAMPSEMENSNKRTPRYCIWQVYVICMRSKIV